MKKRVKKWERGKFEISPLKFIELNKSHHTFVKWIVQAYIDEPFMETLLIEIEFLKVNVRICRARCVVQWKCINLHLSYFVGQYPKGQNLNAKQINNALKLIPFPSPRL